MSEVGQIASLARRQRRDLGGLRLAGLDPRRCATRSRPGSDVDVPATAPASAGVVTRRMWRRGRADLSCLATIPAWSWPVACS